ncbi:hypothetical protein Tco_0950530 [Tanacetum coccineum]
MTLKDFLHFPGIRSGCFSARPANVPMSVGSLAGSAANVPAEELEMAVADPVAKNAVGAEVVPPSMGRLRRGEAARPVGSPWRVIAPSLDVDLKGKRVAFPNYVGSPSFKKRKHVVLNEGPSSPKSVPNFAPSDEACKTLFGSLASTVADPVAKNVVGAEVAPPSAGRLRRGEAARPVGSPRRVIAPYSDVVSKGKKVAFPNSAGSPSFKKRKHVVLDEGPSSPKFVPDFAPSDEACKTLFRSIASTEDLGDSVPFRPGIEEACSSRDALCNLSYLDVQRYLDGQNLTELTNFHDVAAVRFVMSNNLLNCEARALSADVFRLRGEEKAMLMGRSQALRVVASSGIGLKLEDMKDFDPNTEENYDRAIESFYHQIKFPYMDLLVHYAGQSVGKLMTLKPPIIPFGNASTDGPSASPFL